jgi:hypothetical protein
VSRQHLEAVLLGQCVELLGGEPVEAERLDVAVAGLGEEREDLLEPLSLSRAGSMPAGAPAPLLMKRLNVQSWIEILLAGRVRPVAQLA